MTNEGFMTVMKNGLRGSHCLSLSIAGDCSILTPLGFLPLCTVELPSLALTASDFPAKYQYDHISI